MLKLKFAIILLLTFALSRLLMETASSVAAFALVTLPGTFLHELAHYTAALVLNGSPSNFNLIPSGNTLGSVTFSPNWYNAATTALAPALLAPFTAFFAALGARSSSISGTAGSAYLAACSWVACTPSGTDFTIAASYPSSWLIAAAVLPGVSYAVYIVVRRMVQ